MLSKLSQLCKELNIPKANPTPEEISRIEQWCLNHISETRINRTYEEYLDYAGQYLDVFLPHVPEDKSVMLPIFNNMSTIQFAAFHGYDRFLKGTDITSYALNQPTVMGMTPLHLCATNGYVHAVNILLDKGASPLMLNKNNKLPIQCALFTPMLIDDGFKSRKTAIFKRLLAAAPDTISAQDNEGDTVAHAMAAHGYNVLMSDVIKNHTSLIFTPNHFRKYPIHTAILNRQTNLALALLEIDGVSSLKDSHEQTALHYAAQEGELPIVHWFIAHKPGDVSQIDRNGKLAVFYAERASHNEIMELLQTTGSHESNCTP